MIIIQSTKIPDVKVLTPNVFKDDRGFFLESYNKSLLPEYNFVQDNHSCSKKNVLRGLHYQLVKPQTKLVRVVKGKILDVAVDLRKSSKTFGEWVAEELSDENYKQLLVPAGFAHGFLVLSEEAEVLYKTTDFWYKEHDRSLRWNDPQININWNLIEDPILSEKDNNAKLLTEADVYE